MVNRFGQVQLPTASASPAAVAPRNKDTKYTLLLSQPLAAQLEEDRQRLRRSSGLNVTRSDVIRSLLRQLHADQSLYDTVLRDLLARGE